MDRWCLRRLMRGLTFLECGNVRRGDSFLGCCLIFHEWAVSEVQHTALLQRGAQQKFRDRLEAALMWSNQLPSPYGLAAWKELQNFWTWDYGLAEQGGSWPPWVIDLRSSFSSLLQLGKTPQRALLRVPKQRWINGLICTMSSLK